MKTMKAWVLGDPGQLTLVDKPVPSPGVAEVLVRIDATAICATDLEVISPRSSRRYRRRAAVQQELHARPRVHGHDCRSRADRRRICRWRARRRRNPRRLRPLRALPSGDVHLVPQLRPQLRRVQQRASGQRIHDRRRLRAVCGQSRQHARPRARASQRRGRDVDRDRRHRDVRARCPGRTGRWREPRCHRRRPNRSLRRRGRQSARRQPGDPHRHRRQPSCCRHARRRRRCDQRVDASRSSTPCAG